MNQEQTKRFANFLIRDVVSHYRYIGKDLDNETDTNIRVISAIAYFVALCNNPRLGRFALQELIRKDGTKDTKNSS